MHKKVLVSVIAIVLLIAGAVFYVGTRPPKDASVSESSDQTRDSSVAANSDTQSDEKRGMYLDYSEEALANTSGTRLLFFHAPWCPQCRAIEASIESDGIPSGVTVLKVDYDSNQTLRQRYGVTLQTTFVKLDDQGNKIASYVAYEEPRFSSVERELLR